MTRISMLRVWISPQCPLFRSNVLQQYHVNHDQVKLINSTYGNNFPIPLRLGVFGMHPVPPENQTRRVTLEWPSLFSTCLDVPGNFREKPWKPKRVVSRWFQAPMCKNSKHDCGTLCVGSSYMLGTPNILGHRATFIKCSYVFTISWTCPLPCPHHAWFPSWSIPTIAPWLSEGVSYMWAM